VSRLLEDPCTQAIKANAALTVVLGENFNAYSPESEREADVYLSMPKLRGRQTALQDAPVAAHAAWYSLPEPTGRLWIRHRAGVLLPAILMANGAVGGPGQSLPGWLGPIVTVTTQVGVPTVVAGILLWFVLFRVDGAMKIIQEQEETRTKMVSAMQDSLVAALDRQSRIYSDTMDRNIAANRIAADRLEAIVNRQGQSYPKKEQ
jgi:hypothetical protein